jgi:hypothetical protein
VAVPTQQHAKIIEPGNDSLQLDAVHQENGERRFAFADVIEEGVLQILCAIGCHCRDPLLAREPLPRAIFVVDFAPGRNPTSGFWQDY